MYYFFLSRAKVIFCLSVVILLTLFQAQTSCLANNPGSPNCSYSPDQWLADVLAVTGKGDFRNSKSSIHPIHSSQDTSQKGRRKEEGGNSPTGLPQDWDQFLQ